MARVEARIKTTLWDASGDFVQRTAGAQRLYTLILSQPDLSMCGVAPLTVGRWASKAADTTPADIREHLAELAEHRYVVVDEANEEAWLRTFILHDGVLKGHLTIIGMARAWAGINSPSIRASVFDVLPDWFVEGVSKGHAIPLQDAKKELPEGLFRSLPIPFVEGLLACAYARGLLQPPTAVLQPLPSAASEIASSSDLREGGLAS